MKLINKQDLNYKAYTELVQDLENKLLKNTKKRLELYKQKIKLNLSLNAKAITCKKWYYDSLQLNKKEQTLNTDFCLINSSLIKLKSLS